MLHYIRNVVLAAYRAARPDNLEVEEETITAFDEDLFETYDEELRLQAQDNNIPATEFNLSMLVFFAARSSAKLVRTRARHAARFFLSVQPQP